MDAWVQCERCCRIVAGILAGVVGGGEWRLELRDRGEWAVASLFTGIAGGVAVFARDIADFIAGDIAGVVARVGCAGVSADFFTDLWWMHGVGAVEEASDIAGDVAGIAEIEYERDVGRVSMGVIPFG